MVESGTRPDDCVCAEVQCGQVHSDLCPASTAVYDITFITQAMFTVQVEATDLDEAEDLVTDFSPNVA